MPDMSASVSLAMTHLVPLAKEVDENKVTPGVLGFIVFAVMALAVWGLMKSMNRHMSRVEFKEPADPEAPAPESPADPKAKQS
jgi:Ca2+/H+ antiporter